MTGDDFNLELLPRNGTVAPRATSIFCAVFGTFSLSSSLSLSPLFRSCWQPCSIVRDRRVLMKPSFPTESSLWKRWSLNRKIRSRCISCWNLWNFHVLILPTLSKQLIIALCGSLHSTRLANYYFSNCETVNWQISLQFEYHRLIVARGHIRDPTITFPAWGFHSKSGCITQ